MQKAFHLEFPSPCAKSRCASIFTAPAFPGGAGRWYPGRRSEWRVQPSPPPSRTRLMRALS